MEPTTPLFMRSRQAWRRWLERHHARRTEIWIAYYKAHTGKPSVAYVEAVEEALCFGWIDGQVRRIDDDSWCQRFTPRRRGSTWSKPNLRRFARLLAEGRVAEAGRAAGPTTATRVAEAFWDKPDVTPPEVEAGLKRSATAWEHFTALSPSRRKQFVAMIASAKKPETRARRIALAIGMLERREMPMDKYRHPRKAAKPGP
jgi:uncharacterized protein YdeI (YjbR/CyaY-like superfamily)